MSGTSCSITISLIRSPEGSRARAFRPLPGAQRPRSCPFPARRRPAPGGGRERPRRGAAGTDRRVGHLVKDRPVQARAESSERRPVDPGQREPGGMLPGRGQRHVGIQGENGLPPGPVASHRSASTADSPRVTTFRKCTSTSLDMPGAAPSGPTRTRPVRSSPKLSATRESATRPEPDSRAWPPRPGSSDPVAPRQLRTSPKRTRQDDHRFPG